MNEQTEMELTAQYNAEFDKLVLKKGWLELDDLGLHGFNALKEAFEAGVVLGRSLSTQKHSEAAKSDSGASGGHSKKEQATAKQCWFLKALIEGDESKAGQLLKVDELKAVFDDTLTKKEASTLIDRLLKAGLKPKRRK